jgi:hypothetical protein
MTSDATFHFKDTKSVIDELIKVLPEIAHSGSTSVTSEQLAHFALDQSIADSKASTAARIALSHVGDLSNLRGTPHTEGVITLPDLQLADRVLDPKTLQTLQKEKASEIDWGAGAFASIPFELDATLALAIAPDPTMITKVAAVSMGAAMVATGAYVVDKFKQAAANASLETTIEDQGAALRSWKMQ